MKKLKIVGIIALVLVGILVCQLLIVHIGYTELEFNDKVTYEDLRTPEEYNLTVQELDLTTSDNFNIHIYEVLIPDPDGVIIMLTGITGPSVTHFYGQAELVSSQNFASILVDVRGHGKSDGDKVTCAIDDVKDVQAVVNYINNQDRYKDKQILIMGLSMGGATAINSAALIDDIDGVIALSAFSSWTDVNVDCVELKEYPRIIGDLMRPGIITYGLLQYGWDYFEIVPEKSIKKLGDKPIFIMHCTDDSQIPDNSFHRLVAAYNGDNMTTWNREGWEHFVVKENDISHPRTDPEYCEKVLDFLQQFKPITRQTHAI